MATKRLKGVILSVEDTLINTNSKIKTDVFAEVEKLIAFFTLRGIKPVLLANRAWTLTDSSGNKKDLYDEFEKHFRDLAILLDSVILRFHLSHEQPQLSMFLMK